jgi:pimeloyl-ACP methyl ester carboxylesterase
MAYADVNGVKLYYDEFGSGDKVVIAASGGDFKRPDLNQWPFYLSNYGYHVYTVCLRGHWKSTHIFEDYGTEFYNMWADDIYEFGKFVGADRFIYTGLSHGSGVGWHLADRHPEVLKAFVAIVCGPHYLEGGDLNDKLTSPARERTIQAADNPALKAEWIKDQEPDWSKVPADKMAGEKKRWEERKADMEEMSPEEMRLRPMIAFAWIRTEQELIEKLKTIQVPMLMIAGCQDAIVSVNASIRSACAVPNAKTIFYQAGTHVVAYDPVWKDDVRDEILLFLRKY